MQDVLPGQEVQIKAGTQAGPGLFIRGGKHYASLLGTLDVDTTGSKVQDGTTLPGHTRVKPRASSRISCACEALVPKMYSIVLCKVVRLSMQQAIVDVISVDGYPLERHIEGARREGEGFMGLIRSQDIRATEKDKVVVHHAFAVGDIVRAVVISLGDSRYYYLSTANNALGVVYATSRRDPTVALVPVSWDTMKCPSTGQVETRKVAKPDY